MFTFYWVSGFAALLALHFMLMPRIIGAVVASPIGPTDPGAAYVTRCFFV